MARGRTALTLDEKIAKLTASDAELSTAQKQYAEWLEDKTGVTLDTQTFLVAQGLYNDYNKDPEVAATNEERRAAREIANREKKAAAVERARKLLAEMGYEVIETEDDSDDDDDDED